MSLQTSIELNQLGLVLDARAALYIPQTHCLVVADLHFEKASYLRLSGNPLPLYDSLDCIRRLQELVDYYQAKQVICLGDSFHDLNSYERMHPELKLSLERCISSVEVWHWILGNHDPKLPIELDGTANHQIRMKLEHCQLVFSHQELNIENSKTRSINVIGHYHPKMKVKLGNKKIRSTCFVLDRSRLYLPAFGSFTGGLDIDTEDFPAADSGERECYFIYRGNIRRISP